MATRLSEARDVVFYKDTHLKKEENENLRTDLAQTHACAYKIFITRFIYMPRVLVETNTSAEQSDWSVQSEGGDVY